MIKLKFKSLTMRIWTTFTLVILIIIFGISLFYLVAYRNFDETSKIQDLMVTHDMMLASKSYDQSNRFNEFKNLKGVDFFVVKIDSKNNKTFIGKTKKVSELPPNENSQFPPSINVSGFDVRYWMSNFITSKEMSGVQFKESYGEVKFIFAISTIVNNDSADVEYLVTYVPLIHDNKILYFMVLTGLLFIAIGFITAKMVANKISEPLRELEEYTVRIAHKDWKQPIEVNSEDEIGRLANSMNLMQEELKHADKEEKMFLQSISHDLKTPVMVIMSHAEAIVEGVYVESLEKNAEIIRDEAIRLEKKINHLLYLNTLNYVLENNNENGKVNLKSMVIHIVDRFIAVNSKICWEIDVDDLVILGNLDKIQVSIENIVDNGLRYAKENMKISLKKSGDFAEIEIFNDGPEISEEGLERIFDNFYKDKTGNFGLGLAISKKIIDFYKGEISVVNRGIGVSFIIKYPLVNK